MMVLEGNEKKKSRFKTRHGSDVVRHHRIMVNAALVLKFSFLSHDQSEHIMPVGGQSQ